MGAPLGGPLVTPQWAPLSKALGRLGKREALQIVYEAGPCGYTLARELRAHGYACEVIAPAKIARRPGDRIKTDRRDALLLARAARAGELVSVMIPDERDEALRDLSRAREDAVRARLKARQQLKALLLRHGHRYTGRSSWTQAHERYLATVSFAQPAQDIAFAEYRSAVGGILCQGVDRISPRDGWKVVSDRKPTAGDMDGLEFAWIVCAHVKSNAIVLTGPSQSIGIGAGQMSRVDAAKVAVMKATAPAAGSFAASDAFFPFRDGLDILADAGVRAVIQPGGSVRDAEVVAAADERGLAMVFTGERQFQH